MLIMWTLLAIIVINVPGRGFGKNQGWQQQQLAQSNANANGNDW